MSSVSSRQDLSPTKEQTVVPLRGPQDRLPSGNYTRFVVHSLDQDGKPTRNDFAVHKHGARFCRLLDSILDAADLNIRSKPDPITGLIPPVTFNQTIKESCEIIFEYLELLQTRIPTNISKPLRAPLEELIQPWEMRFLIERCFENLSLEANLEFTTSNLFKAIVKRGPRCMDRILEVAMLSDFLIIESLRNLTCAFLASLGLSATNQSELLELCGLDAPLSEEDLEPVYAQLGFLRFQ